MKPMLECSGSEILEEALRHLGLEEQAQTIGGVLTVEGKINFGKYEGLEPIAGQTPFRRWAERSKVLFRMMT